ncbi:MAG: hypothetical protein PHR83_06225 [Paludibacter sp.]|nr:hypothetical protein [Paludibacter sp.]
MIHKSNNIGAISALKGYRVQFLYALNRILSYKVHEREFHSEGQYEDLDVYNEEGEVIEIIQVKDYSDTMALSKILSKKENTFIRRALKAYNENKTPIIKLVSFGNVSNEIKELSSTEYSQKLISKLKGLQLKNHEIEILQRNFEYEIADENIIKNNVIANIQKWGTLIDVEKTFNLLLHAIYYASEKQEIITPITFKKQFDEICKFQKERISFNKTYNSLIRQLDTKIDTENIEQLQVGFYNGISANYKHILADVDVKRIDKLDTIQNKFHESNIVFIHGASGQGKSTLAYRYLHDYHSLSTVYELKQLPENINKVYEVIEALEGISKGIRFPITIYIDIEPGNKDWINILIELSTNKHFNFLITIREEDWNSIEIKDKFSFTEIELLFEKEEAERIYESLNDHSLDLRFVDFEDAWAHFGGKGPLLEFVYLITHSETLSEKLKSQINKIRKDSDIISGDKINLLRYVVLADCFGSKIKLKEINQFLKPQKEITLLLDLLQNEYLIRISGDRTSISGLHPVRSKIIRDLLFDNEINIELDYVLNALPFISDNTILNFLRNGFIQSKLSPNILIEKLKLFEPQKWEVYLQILKALQWKGIADYLNRNINTLNQVYEEYNNGWMIVVNPDLVNILDEGGIMVNSGIFSEEQKQYAKNVNDRITDKKEIFNYCISWLKGLKSIDIIPDNKNDWNAFGLFLFWLDYFNVNGVIVKFQQFEFERTLRNQPLDVIAHVLYGLKKYSIESGKYVEEVEKFFLQKLSETYNIIAISRDKHSIKCDYLFDVIDEKIETQETDIFNAKSVKIVELLRIAFPDEETYETKGVGHQISLISDDYDSSIKKISRNNLPLPQLVEINSTFINLFDYTKRPNSWQEYVKEVVQRRLLFVDVLSKMTYAFGLYHKHQSFNPLAEYYNDYNSKYRNAIRVKVKPKFPQSVVSEFGEGGIKSIKTPQTVNNNSGESNINQMLAIQKYNIFSQFYNNCDSSIENYLTQGAEYIYLKAKILSKEDVSEIHNPGRVSLGNLFRAYELILEFQHLFRAHFEKFVDPYKLRKIELEEIEKISILCFLYRQFIYSDRFISGNVLKLAFNKINDTNESLEDSVVKGLKVLAKEQECQISVSFSKEEKRCIITVDHTSAIKTFELLGLIYNKLYEQIEQPDYTSIRYLILSTNYPTFNIIFRIKGKVINQKWFEFKTYNLRERKFDELEPFNFLPKDIPNDVIERFKIDSWNNTLIEFKDLDKLLGSVSMLNQLANHFYQLRYFKNKKVEDYSEKVWNDYTSKISGLLQENLTNGLNLFAFYLSMCDNGEIDFKDDNERNDFFQFSLDSHPFFYPNENAFKKSDFGSLLGEKELKTWIPRLEKLTSNIAVMYYFLADKIIEKSQK